MCLYFVMHSCVFILSCTHLCFLKPFLLSKPPFSGWYHRHWHRSDSSIQGAGQSTPAAFVRELSLERHWGQHCGPVSRPWQVCHLHLLCSQYSIFWACVGKYDRLSVFLLPHWPISWGSGRPALVVPAPVCELQQGWGVAEWVEHRVQQAADTSSSLWCGKGLNPRVSPWQMQEETDWMKQARVQNNRSLLVFSCRGAVCCKTCIDWMWQWREPSTSWCLWATLPAWVITSRSVPCWATCDPGNRYPCCGWHFHKNSLGWLPAFREKSRHSRG